MEVAKGILSAILEGHVEGLADAQEDMEHDGADDDDQAGSNRRRRVCYHYQTGLCVARCALHAATGCPTLRSCGFQWQSVSNAYEWVWGDVCMGCMLAVFATDDPPHLAHMPACFKGRAQILLTKVKRPVS